MPRGSNRALYNLPYVFNLTLLRLNSDLENKTPQQKMTQNKTRQNKKQQNIKSPPKHKTQTRPLSINQKNSDNLPNQISFKPIPYHKTIPNSNIAIDYFELGANVYFLSHFHSDHYKGLRKSFRMPVYTSKTTGNLLKTFINPENVIFLDMYKWYRIEDSASELSADYSQNAYVGNGDNEVGKNIYNNNVPSYIYVFLIDANHCPGSVCFLFLKDHRFYLHTGDFRYERRCFDFLVPFKYYFILQKGTDKATLKLKFDNNIYRNHPTHIRNIKYTNIYLDNTYENFKPFKPQKEIIHSLLRNLHPKLSLGYNIATNLLHSILFPYKTQLVFATYLIGKEKIFLTVAEFFDKNIFVESRKRRIFECFDMHAITLLNKSVMDCLSGFNCENKVGMDGINNKDNYCHDKNISREVFDEGKEKEIFFNYKKIKECKINFDFQENEKVQNHYFKPYNIKNGCFKEENRDNCFKEDKKNGFSKEYNKDGCYKTYNFDVKTDKISVDIKKDKINVDDKKDKIKHNYLEKSIHPFNRITFQDPHNKILLISMMDLNPKKLNLMFKDLKTERILIIVGTGWKEKQTFYNWKRGDGRTIKKGIEILYVPYSEHSSSRELEMFKNDFLYDDIINTVNYCG